MLVCRQLLRNKQAEQQRLPPSRSNSSGSSSSTSSRKGKTRKAGGRAVGSQTPEARPSDGAAAPAVDSKGGKPGGPVTPSTPPPIRKQRSRDRGESSTEGDAASTASSAASLPPDTPAQVSILLRPVMILPHRCAHVQLCQVWLRCWVLCKSKIDFCMLESFLLAQGTAFSLHTSSLPANTDDCRFDFAGAPAAGPPRPRALLA